MTGPAIKGCIAILIPLAALAADAPYAGSGVCSQCHQAEASRQSSSAMANALETVADCAILKAYPKLKFREGPYASEIVREGDRSILTVSNGSEKLTVPLQYAFGLGKAGQTYVFEYGGFFHESRASFFAELQGLDLTMGAQGSHPASLEEAAGRRMTGVQARDCFGCHTTGPERSPGVDCENCHGPSARHVAAVRAGNTADAKMTRLSKLSTEEMSDFCGRCHRTWSYVAMNGPRGVNNVRFQPYRLTNSKCYDAADARIRCAACHDPHQNAAEDAAFYDSKCEACHSAAAGAKTCKVAKSGCVTCHMPKTALPGAHHRFTDHQIRIARAGAPYPN